MSNIVYSVYRQFGYDTKLDLSGGYAGLSSLLLLSFLVSPPNFSIAAEDVSLFEGNPQRAEELDERSRLLSALPRLQRGRESPSLQLTVHGRALAITANSGSG